jgi:prolyl oligopeptidase
MQYSNCWIVSLVRAFHAMKNPKGIWRKTTMESYESNSPSWTTVLDVDELAQKESQPWVWRGSRVLPRARDPMSEDGKRATRALLSLSKGAASETVVVREFDLLKSAFVTTDGFVLPEGKSRACYRSRDVLLVGGDFGPDSLTNSGYPRTIREWVRGTDIRDAPVVFEGEKGDMAVSSYIDDQRLRGGGIFEVRTRALAPNNSKCWVRKIKPEHLLPSNDSQRLAAGDPGSFKEVETPGDAEVDFIGNLLMITLRSDWSPESGKKFRAGSLIYVNSHKFVKYGPKDRIYHVLFQPEDRVTCENYCATKNFLIVSVMDNLKSKLEFYRFEKDANKLRLVGMDKNGHVRSVNVRSVDPYEGDEFWLSTTGYTEATTLYLGDAAKMDTDDKKKIRKTGSEGYIVRKLKALPEQFDSSGIEVIQKSVASKDGTEIPYFMIMKSGASASKRNVTLLYGYGGFEVSLGPQYIAPTGIAWLERGGVYVEANIRGGGEFGPNWHQVRRYYAMRLTAIGYSVS